MTIRAVIDTSALAPSGLRRELQQAAQLGLLTALWSPWIIAELNRVLVWRWIKDPPPDRPLNDLSRANERRCSVMAQQMMSWLFPSFEVVTPLPPYPPPWTGLSDRGDHPIWAAAVEGKAQYVVSENTRHYPPRGASGRHVYQGIEYLPGRVFLTLLAGQWTGRSEAR